MCKKYMKIKKKRKTMSVRDTEHVGLCLVVLTLLQFSTRFPPFVHFPFLREIFDLISTPDESRRQMSFPQSLVFLTFLNPHRIKAVKKKKKK